MSVPGRIRSFPRCRSRHRTAPLPARPQLESLRRSLEAAARRLGTQSRGLVAQYTRDLALTDTLRLLGDIQACVEVPARVARLEESKVGAGQPVGSGLREQQLWWVRRSDGDGRDAVWVQQRRSAGCAARDVHAWEQEAPEAAANGKLDRSCSVGALPLMLPQEWPMAVSLLLDGCNKLARQELQSVGALRELAADMGRRRTALLAGLVAELEARVYRLGGSPGLPPGGAAAAAAVGDAGALLGGDNGGAGRPPVPRLALPTGGSGALQQQRGSSSQEREFSSAAGNLSGRGLPPRPPGGAGMLPRTASFGREAGGDALAPMASLPRRAVHRRAQTLGGLMPAAAGLTAMDGHLVDAELPQSSG